MSLHELDVNSMLLLRQRMKFKLSESSCRILLWYILISSDVFDSFPKQKTITEFNVDTHYDLFLFSFSVTSFSAAPTRALPEVTVTQWRCCSETSIILSTLSLCSLLFLHAGPLLSLLERPQIILLLKKNHLKSKMTVVASWACIHGDMMSQSGYWYSVSIYCMCIKVRQAETPPGRSSHTGWQTKSSQYILI